MKTEALKQLREVHAIQGRDGCWDIDDYMLGLYNGLELALSIVENRECRYKDRPKTQRTAAKGEDTRRAWVGLTEEEVKHMLELFVVPPHHVEMVVQAIEAKLKEKNHD